MFCEERGTKNHISEFIWCVAGISEEKLVYPKVDQPARAAPAIVTISGDHFNWEVSRGSDIGRMNQLIIAPLLIAPVARNIIGVVQLVSASLVICTGKDILLDQRLEMDRRIE